MVAASMSIMFINARARNAGEQMKSRAFPGHSSKCGEIFVELESLEGKPKRKPVLRASWG